MEPHTIAPSALAAHVPTYTLHGDAVYTGGLADTATNAFFGRVLLLIPDSFLSASHRLGSSLLHASAYRFGSG